MIMILLSSKKFVASLAGVLFVVLNQVAGIGIDEDAVIQIVGLLAAYVVGQGIADNGKEKVKALGVLASLDFEEVEEATEEV